MFKLVFEALNIEMSRGSQLRITTRLGGYRNIFEIYSPITMTQHWVFYSIFVPLLLTSVLVLLTSGYGGIDSCSSAAHCVGTAKALLLY